ncbi:MAG: sigma-70 family RNA polymerase sigma factor [Ruminococcus sp.]|nr:sigma-70 family RNA polymerase sigma factor [Ruminococcus sp.]
MKITKVQITGLNTSKIQVLSEDEKTELIKKAQSGDKKAKDKMVMCNLKLVLRTIQPFLTKGDDPDDIFEVGTIGLLKAVDRFDVNMGVKFSSYCVPLILGECKRYFRDGGALRVSRSMRDTAFKAFKAKEKYIEMHQREPNTAQIADMTDIPERDIIAALEAVNEPVSIYEPVYSDAGDTLYVIDQLSDNDSAENWLDEINVKETIKKLPKREKDILYLRYFLGKTQVEVAGSVGISQAQVSRLEKGALNKIKMLF